MWISFDTWANFDGFLVLHKILNLLWQFGNFLLIVIHSIFELSEQWEKICLWFIFGDNLQEMAYVIQACTTPPMLQLVLDIVMVI